MKETGAMRRRAELRRALIVLALLGSSCSSPYWTRAGATDEQFYRDSHECALEASPSRDAPGVEHLKIDEDLYRGCMLALGYRRDKYLVRPTPGWRGLAE